jgi:hypothetical protein
LPAAQGWYEPNEPALDAAGLPRTFFAGTRHRDALLFVLPISLRTGVAWVGGSRSLSRIVDIGPTTTTFLANVTSENGSVREIAALTPRWDWSP